MTSSHFQPLAGTAYIENRDARSGSWAAVAPHILAGTLLFVFAAALRASQLNKLSLWFDDAWVALVSRMSASQVIHVGMTSLGFDTILWGWFKVVGFSEVSAKLIPFLAGCLTPVIAYALIIRKGLGWIPASIAGLILVVAPADVQYAATVKQYTCEALLTVVLVWMAWTVLEGPRRGNIIWLGALACTSVVISSMTVFVAAPAVCISMAWTALKNRERRLDCIIVAVAALAFIGVWLPLMAGDASNPALRLYWSNYYVVHTGGIGGMAASTLDLAEHFAAGVTHRRFIYLAVVAVGATIFTLYKRPLLTGILWLPVVFVYLAALIGRAPFGGGRTDIFLHPLLAVLVALAFYEVLRSIHSMFAERPWQTYLTPIAALVVLVPILRGARPAFPSHPDEDLRPLARFVMGQKQEGDVVILYPGARHEWFLYSKEPFSIAPREEHPFAFPYTMEAKNTVVLDDYPPDSSAYASEVDRAIGAKRIWLVASHLGYINRPGSETEPVERRIRSKGFLLKTKETRPRALVELWVRPS